MIRSVPFWEFRERVELKGFRSNAISGMWNWLAEHLISFRRTNEEPANCVIPLELLLNFTPGMAEVAEGIGSARFAVYEAVYKSFIDNPESLPGHSHEMTRESLDEFGTEYSATARGNAWYEFRRAVSDWGGSPQELTVADLERYCEQLRVTRPSTMQYQLLSEWLRYLQSQLS